MQNHGHKTLQDVEFCSHLYTLGVLSETVKCQIKPQVNLLRGGQCHGVAVFTWEKSFSKCLTNAKRLSLVTARPSEAKDLLHVVVGNVKLFQPSINYWMC